MYFLTNLLSCPVRVSLTGEDVRLVLTTAETVGLAKKKLSEQESIAEPAQQRWYFGGKLLGNHLFTVHCKGQALDGALQCSVTFVQETS